MSRVAFAAAPGCPTVSVTLVNTATLPFCSIPSFAAPAFRPPVPVLPVPDFAPPETCVSVAISINISQPSIIDISRVRFSGSVGRRYKDVDDACAGLYSMRLDLDIPCLPFSMKTDSSSPTGMMVSMKPISVPNTRFSITKDSCKLKLKLSMQLPCVPFSFVSTQGTVTQPNVTAVSAEFKISKKPDACQFTPTLNLTLPCTPFSFAEGSMHLSMMDQDAFSGTLRLSRVPDACQFRPKMCLHIPCIPFSFNTGITTLSLRAVTTSTIVNLRMSKTLNESCAFTPKLSLKLPCIPFTLGAQTSITANCTIGTQAAKLRLRVMKTNCSIRVSGTMSIVFPQGFTQEQLVLGLSALPTITNPKQVLGRTSNGSIGWVAVVSFDCSGY